MIYPKTLEILIECLKKIPGIGEKSAERMALSIIEMNEEDINTFSKSLTNSKLNLKKCENCGHISEESLCKICSDKSRNHNLICVVEDYKSVFVFEKTANYKGIYHVLDGLISPMDMVNPEDINISGLLKRLNKNQTFELIIALKPTIEGDTTTMYLQKILEQNKNIKISRLSYGIPMGAEIEYLDALTLARALDDRKEIS